MRIDLNADLGELGLDHDAPLLESISSASLAAGLHAGNPSSLRAIIRHAKARGVALGAHPSFDDRAHFGRREMTISPGDAEALLAYQIGAVAAVAELEGVRLQHVKPHGALYNMAARDRGLADAVARAIKHIDPRLILLAPYRSALSDAGRAASLETAAEGFADRAYQSDGQLVPRHHPGAMIEDITLATARAVRMVKEKSLVAADGTTLAIEVDTICVHGDTPEAADLARALRTGFQQAGVVVRSLR